MHGAAANNDLNQVQESVPYPPAVLRPNNSRIASYLGTYSLSSAEEKEKHNQKVKSGSIWALPLYHLQAAIYHEQTVHFNRARPAADQVGNWPSCPTLHRTPNTEEAPASTRPSFCQPGR